MQSMKKKILIPIIVAFAFILMGVVFGNESYASKKCESCGEDLEWCRQDDKNHAWYHRRENYTTFHCKKGYTWKEKHTGGTHKNGGKCTVCGDKYQEHTMKLRFKKTATSHIPVYKCSYSGCGETSTSSQGAKHKGGTHKNEGTCTVCHYKYQNHSKSNNLKGYTSNSKGHTPTYKCSHSGCTATYTGTTVNHTRGTHKNGGRCTVCGYKYQNHSNSKSIKSYKTTAKQHTPVYKCSYSGCSTTYTGSAAKHTGGTHENGGKCTVCKHKYQTHSKSKSIKSYKTTAKKHTPVYKCSCSGCKKTYTGSAVNHTGGTHKNGGKCTACGYKYQTHSKSKSIKSYKITREKHTPIYKCSHSGCSTTYTGATVKHTGGTLENGGKCTECGYVYQTYKEDDGTVSEKNDNDNVDEEVDIDISKDKDGSVMVHIKKYTNSTENNSSLEMTISGNGIMQESVFQKLVDDNIINADSIIDIFVIEDGVTNISDYAFKDIYILGPIYIPSTVETIGKEAFMNASKKKDGEIICNLETVTIEGDTQIGEGAFKNCDTLNNIYFQGTSIIEKSAFENCTSISKVTFPERITTIGNNAFYGCKNLISVVIPQTVTSIGDKAFEKSSGAFTIFGEKGAYSETYAKDNNINYVYSRDKSSREIDISAQGDGTIKATIETSMYRYPTVVVNGSLIVGGSNGSEVTISGSGKMKEKPFEGENIGTSPGSSISKLTIEEGVTNISKGAFSELYISGNVEIPKTVETIEQGAFSDGNYVEIQEGRVYGIKSLSIDGETLVGESAFENCGALESVSINGDANVIGKKAFKKCDYLKEVAISEGTTTIEDEAFNSCSALEIVAIPKSVTSIGNQVFENCSSNLKIYGEQGSKAETYAKNNNITFINADRISQKDIDISKDGDNSIKAHVETTEYVVPTLQDNDITASKKHNIIISGDGVMKSNPFEGENIGNSENSYIESLTFENGVTNICEGAFEGLYIQGNIVIPKTVEKIGKGAFKGIQLESTDEEVSYGIENVTIEGNIQIEESAFENSPKLGSVSIAGNATIAKNAFKNCNNLKEVRILGNTNNIDKEAFSGCDKDQLVIYCIENSDVQQYAKENGFKVETISAEAQEDKIPPKLTISYSNTEPTTENIEVTIIADEEIKPLDGWTLLTDRKGISKEYDSNTQEEITIEDLAGNKTTQEIKITNIVDSISNEEDEYPEEIEDKTSSDEISSSENDSNNDITSDNENNQTENYSKGNSNSSPQTFNSILPKTGVGRILLGTALVGIVLSSVLYIKYKKTY